jgi:hypothetical protein
LSSGLGHGYFPLHCGWFDRDGVSALIATHGPLGPATILYLCSLANQQDGFREGTVVSGCQGVAKALYAKAADVHKVIDLAGSSGVLDDLEWFDDGSRFTCRISGWLSDREGAGLVNQRESAAARQAAKRERDKALKAARDGGVTGRDSNAESRHPNPNPNNNTSKESSKAGERPAIAELSALLAEAIQERLPDAKTSPKSESWLRGIRLAIDQDGRSVEQMRAMILWAHRESPFWWKVILSPDALRKNFDKMAAARMGDREQAKRESSSSVPDSFLIPRSER